MFTQMASKQGLGDWVPELKSFIFDTKAMFLNGSSHVP